MTWAIAGLAIVAGVVLVGIGLTRAAQRADEEAAIRRRLGLR